jgi:hypothetical protein
VQLVSILRERFIRRHKGNEFVVEIFFDAFAEQDTELRMFSMSAFLNPKDILSFASAFRAKR